MSVDTGCGCTLGPRCANKATQEDLLCDACRKPGAHFAPLDEPSHHLSVEAYKVRWELGKA